jgi:hypothetical protein
VEDQDLQDLAGKLDQEEDMTMDDGADSDESEQSGAENDVVDEVALLTPAEQKAGRKHQTYQAHSRQGIVLYLP